MLGRGDRRRPADRRRDRGARPARPRLAADLPRQRAARHRRHDRGDEGRAGLAPPGGLLHRRAGHRAAGRVGLLLLRAARPSAARRAGRSGASWRWRWRRSPPRRSSGRSRGASGTAGHRSCRLPAALRGDALWPPGAGSAVFTAAGGFFLTTALTPAGRPRPVADRLGPDDAAAGARVPRRVARRRAARPSRLGGRRSIVLGGVIMSAGLLMQALTALLAYDELGPVWLAVPMAVTGIGQGLVIVRLVNVVALRDPADARWRGERRPDDDASSSRWPPARPSSARSFADASRPTRAGAPRRSSALVIEATLAAVTGAGREPAPGAARERPERRARGRGTCNCTPQRARGWAPRNVSRRCVPARWV